MLRADPRPLYVQAADRIGEIIETDGLSPGDLLPSEVTLAVRLGVSRSTIREALRDLELHGRIQRIHGRGTVVAKPSPILTGLTTLESLESLAARQGWQCGTQDVAIQEVPALELIAAFFDQPPRTPVTYLVRVKTRDGHPIARMETWLLTTVMAADEMRIRFKHSITDLLLANQSPHLDYAIAEVGASTAKGAAAAALKVKRGTPLVVLTERCYENPATPICFNLNSFLPESIRLEVARLPIARLKR